MDAAVERRMGSDRETRVQPLHLRFLSSSVSLGFPSFAYGRLRRGVEWIVRGTERMRRENVVTRGEEISETRRRKPGHYVPSLSYHIILFTKRYIKIILCEVISDERRLPVLPSSSSIRPSCRSFLSPLGRRPRPTTGGRWEP